ncbi:hypothetical protein [Streptomyces sp. NPDC056452]|uniref:hypothetical protein n=1 Tax=Streptomyces sp. NPDC056452 TaxID=3345821 RepID=UPI003674974D
MSFTNADRVRDVIRNFNTHGFDSLYPKVHRQRRQIGGDAANSSVEGRTHLAG